MGLKVKLDGKVDKNYTHDQNFDNNSLFSRLRLYVINLIKHNGNELKTLQHQRKTILSKLEKYLLVYFIIILLLIIFNNSSFYIGNFNFQLNVESTVLVALITGFGVNLIALLLIAMKYVYNPLDTILSHTIDLFKNDHIIDKLDNQKQLSNETRIIRRG